MKISDQQSVFLYIVGLAFFWGGCIGWVISDIVAGRQ